MTSVIVQTEIDSGRPIASGLFLQRFGDLPPDRGRHFVCLAADEGGGCQLLSYVHIQPFGDIGLVGGACTDTRAVRRLGPEPRESLRAGGGPYRLVLGYALRKAQEQFLACFGHTSDPLATRIDLAAGFRETAIEHLLIYSAAPLDLVLERALIAKAAAIGPF